MIIKNEKEINAMRQGGKLLALITRKLVAEVKPRVTTGYLEKMANVLINQAGGSSSFKGYKSGKDDKPFPTTLCACINNEVVHAPSLPSRELKSGDILKIDIAMKWKGYHADMATTIAVGKVSHKVQKLIRTTARALSLGIEQVWPGNSLNDIGKTIERYVKASGFSVVLDLVGHGVGKNLHEDPQVPNYDVAENNKIILKSGMVLAIEPMVNAGSWQIKNSSDDLTILTADNSLSAHFEHTVLVTEQGHEVLTLPPC